MQIQQQLHRSIEQIERSSEGLREGGVHKATVTERIGKNEAILSIRGQEIKATFEGGVPQGEKVTVQIMGKEGEMIHVRSVPDEGERTAATPVQKNDVGQILRQLGASEPTPELRQAAQMLIEKNIPLTKEAVQELQRFLTEENKSARLQTVQALANKNLEVTRTHLTSVHEALHGRPLNQVFDELAQEVDKDFKMEPKTEGKEQVSPSPGNREIAKAVERATVEASHLEKIGRERMEQSLQQLEKTAATEKERGIAKELRALLQSDSSLSKVIQVGRTITEQIDNKDMKQQIEKALLQAEQLERVGRERLLQVLTKEEQQTTITTNVQGEQDENSLTDLLKQTQVKMQREANFHEALKYIDEVLNHQAVSKEAKSMIQEAVNEATNRMDKGLELSARKTIMEPLQQLEQAMRSEATVYEQNERIQTGMELTSKNIAVTTVTEKLAQITAQFKTLQRDITRTLDVVAKQIELFRSQAQAQAKPLLETTIKKLDNAILRSEMMLLTDMKTEKQLMQASGQLAEAKKLLAKGSHQAANQIVKDVKQLVERLHFQPSDTKVKHYVAMNERPQLAGRTPVHTFTHQYSETATPSYQEGSARAMFEMVRGLGLNRDHEVAGQLASNRHLNGQLEESQRDMKSALMKLIKSEEEGSRANQLANQALTNVTGQQLLSRADQQGNMQSMFFNLPLLLQEKVQNLQVFVHSRNGGETVDWENCQLYFLMETEKMGEIGIMVQAAERQLSVTLKNDKQDFEPKIKPLVNRAIERLSSIGYSINGIKFSKLTNEEQNGQMENAPSPKPIFTKEGFDFKI